MSIEKAAYVLGSKLWEYDFDHLLSLVKEYVVGVWDACKHGDDSCPSQLQSLAEDLQLAGVEGQMGGQDFIQDFKLGGGGGEASLVTSRYTLPILRVGSNSKSEDDGYKMLLTKVLNIN